MAQFDNACLIRSECLLREVAETLNLTGIISNSLKYWTGYNFDYSLFPMLFDFFYLCHHHTL